MSTFAKTLLTILLGLAAVLPLLGGDTAGGGGGDGGVWILPRCANLSGGQNVISLPIGLARDHYSIPDPSRGLEMRVSEDMGEVVAVLTEGTSGFVRSLGVDGHTVRVSGTLFVSLQRAGVRRANVVISDDDQNGYLMAIVFDNGQITAYVF